MFKALPKFALTVLSMPVSNSDCEREFSKINNIKTKKRNKLITPTVNGILHANQAVRKQGGCCVNFSPLPKMLNRMSKSMYTTPSQVHQKGVDADIADTDIADASELFSFAD